MGSTTFNKPLADETAALNGKITNIQTESNGWIAKKNNRIVSLDLSGASITGQSVANILPEGFRPQSNVNVFSKVYDGSSYVDCVVRVNTSGGILVNTPLSTSISGAQLQYLLSNPIVFLV